MSLKFASVLLRAEADQYRAQGLLREARSLYRRFLSAHPGLPPELREAIDREQRRIAREIDCGAVDEFRALNDELMAVIRIGWNTDATREEVLTTAMALFRVGRLAEALEALKRFPAAGAARPAGGPPSSERKAAAAPAAACATAPQREAAAYPKRPVR
jgi:hypothetical protein